MKKELKNLNFFNNVMMYLNIHDWKIEIKNDNYCWNDKKTITIDSNYNGDIRQIILHEIAHINTSRFSNQKHNPQFWKHLKFLTKKFLKKELDEIQIKHKSYMTNGYYNKCYQPKYNII